MQEDVENRTVTLAISGAKLTGRALKWAMRQFINHRSKARAKAVTPRGKQSVRDLIGQNQGVQNIEISDKNIRDFDRVARKYGIDYAVKKDVTEPIPKYLVFNLLCEKADDEFGGRLPIHVRCLIDECANIGQIPNLEKLMATIRSREISACLVLQAQSQLKALYKDSADTIIGNCDASLFLGGREPTTLKELNQTLGRETIDTFNTGESRGREVSHSLNYQKLGKDLATVDELAVLDGDKCILQLRGVRPFLSDKYDITKHPNYKYLSDADKRNEFDIERFLSRRLKPKPDEVYDTYEIDASAMDADDDMSEAE